MRGIECLRAAALLAAVASVGCVAADESPRAEAAKHVASLQGLACGPIVRPVFPPPVAEAYCSASAGPDPDLEVTLTYTPCNRGELFELFIGIRNYEVSFNVSSDRDWQSGMCDWGTLSGRVTCSDQPLFGEVGSFAPATTTELSDSLAIAIEPGGYSPTSLELFCPSDKPYVHKASSLFLPEGTVPVIETN
jgi:hypothetical protein